MLLYKSHLCKILYKTEWAIVHVFYYLDHSRVFRYSLISWYRFNPLTGYNMLSCHRFTTLRWIWWTRRMLSIFLACMTPRYDDLRNWKLWHCNSWRDFIDWIVSPSCDLCDRVIINDITMMTFIR